MRSISGSGAKAPAGAGQRPAARRAGAGVQRAEPSAGCRAAPCRPPRRRGCPEGRALGGVQGLSPAARRAGVPN
ncbi:hypothetical protein D7X33_13750 [Butyricicoccus sp. 1XD8-22]|nr:hypothetical protein D7X33_13750 [Butyricicoccus sp. 1XD8-22]